MDEASVRDLSLGVPVSDLRESEPLPGKVNGQDVILIRIGSEVLATDALCSHYHSPLKDGRVVGDTIRCPNHHACFSLRTGEALTAPALDQLQCWRTEQVGDLVFVREPLKPAPPSKPPTHVPESVVIVGGGAAGVCAAEMLRRRSYRGAITILSADIDAPYDRPNTSKDFLVGAAPPDWMPLRVPDYYEANDIDLRLSTRVSSINKAEKQVVMEDGSTLSYGALVLATGAQPVTLSLDGMRAGDIFYLRSFEDARRLVAAATSAKRIVIVGASFIGLEAAASLRTRGIEVHVVAPDKIPMAKVLGEEIGQFIRGLHEEHGVMFHLERRLVAADGKAVVMDDGSRIEGVDLVVAGIGVRPRVELAEQAGITLDRGVLVDSYLRTSDPSIYAAGDIARWPDIHSGLPTRVEHFVVAQRQGQTVAKNILGERKPFDKVPFFWSQHYDLTVNYVGHAEHFDRARITGSPESRDCQIDYVLDGKILATATIGRDKANLDAELRFESVRMEPTTPKADAV